MAEAGTVVTVVTVVTVTVAATVFVTVAATVFVTVGTAVGVVATVFAGVVATVFAVGVVATGVTTLINGLCGKVRIRARSHSTEATANSSDGTPVI